MQHVNGLRERGDVWREGGSDRKTAIARLGGPLELCHRDLFPHCQLAPVEPNPLNLQESLRRHVALATGWAGDYRDTLDQERRSPPAEAFGNSSHARPFLSADIAGHKSDF